MKPKDAPVALQLSKIVQKKTVVLVQDSLKLPYPQCWSIKQKRNFYGDLLIFRSSITKTHTNGCDEHYENPDNWRITYRLMFGDYPAPFDLWDICQNPIEIEYEYNTFWPLSTESFYIITVHMKYFNGFEIID